MSEYFKEQEKQTSHKFSEHPARPESDKPKNNNVFIINHDLEPQPLEDDYGGVLYELEGRFYNEEGREVFLDDGDEYFGKYEEEDGSSPFS